MAAETARIRWPRIVQDMIDDVESTIRDQDHSLVVAEDGTKIARRLTDLKRDIIDDKPLTTLPSQASPDFQWVNDRIEESNSWSWLDSPWLFTECYMYSRVRSIFLESSSWKTYDVFERQKKSTFINSQVAVQELALRYIDTVSELADSRMTPEQQSALFLEMAQVALWGNATDLSMLTHLSIEDLQSLQGRETIQKQQRNIVDNDLPQVWAYLTSAEFTSGERMIDIVLDNSGFELFTDMVFAAYLLEFNIAKRIRFHVKDFPWFVSDAMTSDVQWLLEALKSTQYFANRACMDALSSRLEGLFEDGKIEIASHWFWTAGSSYHEMHERAPELVADLKSRDLVIFKGDLHYRKLTNDGLWPHLTSFKRALGPLVRQGGPRILSLRTNKADVCVGLESEEQLKELEAECPNGGWVRNGKYAVASFTKGD
ncbi:uncharacterized protein AB675_658 [Cyphellophora attinorum]|uniref:Sugar phosphate phosphatase n=1 Tax=Cyphellophora attinorum TaxID=1664694 RepID=A0A0N1HI87_9EURO|nr:uncharacterized protein AB675_658 [Phialophora attinorum]KPI45975.1 hypothetical protein AB675_658 [Phialophora attinorum]